MVRNTQAALFIGIFLGVVGAAQAVEFSLSPSYTIPVGSTRDLYKSGASLHANVFVPVIPTISIGGEFGIVFNQKIKDTLVGDFDADNIQDSIALTSFPKDGDVTSFHLVPVVRWTPTDEDGKATVKPYLLAGAGFFKTTSVSTDASGDGTLSGGSVVNASVASYERESRNDAGIILGGGVNVQVSPMVFVGAGLRYQHIFRNQTSKGVSVDDSNFIEPSITLGLTF